MNRSDISARIKAAQQQRKPGGKPPAKPPAKPPGKRPPAKPQPTKRKGTLHRLPTGGRFEVSWNGKCWSGVMVVGDWNHHMQQTALFTLLSKLDREYRKAAAEGKATPPVYPKEAP